MTTVVGARIRAKWPTLPTAPIPNPVMMMCVRSGIRDARYITVRVFPVPGGP